jgi:hypothetical protein
MSVLILGVGIGDLAFFKDLALFLSQFSYRNQLYMPFFNGAWEPLSTPCHDLAWCRVIVELPHHKGSLGITPLPASGMAAFYSATAHMVSWLGSLPHASEWVAGQNLANPNTWNSSALQTLKQFFLQEQIKDHHHLHDNLVTSTSGHKAHHANVDAACAGAAKSAYGSHACRAHASSHPIGAHA